MPVIPVKFPCGDLTLEGAWLLPEGEGPFPAVVVCHPYPPGGGTMHNNVVLAVSQALYERSIATFRFNFRGVEGSEGEFGQGIAEREDVKAALDFILSEPRVDKVRTGLAGYSFGGMVSLQVAVSDERVRTLALISAPMREDKNWGQFEGYALPKLYIIGDSDQMVSVDGFHRQVTKSPHAENYILVNGPDHFWAGYEKELVSHVAEFFKRGI